MRGVSHLVFLLFMINSHESVTQRWVLPFSLGRHNAPTSRGSLPDASAPSLLPQPEEFHLQHHWGRHRRLLFLVRHEGRQADQVKALEVLMRLRLWVQMVALWPSEKIDAPGKQNKIK